MPVYAERKKSKLTGLWVAEVTVGGQRYRKRFPIKADADQWHDTTKLIGHPPAEAAKLATRTFGDVADEARKRKAEWREGRDGSLDQRLETVKELIGASVPIGAVDAACVDEMIVELAARPGKRPGSRMSPKTINRYLAALSGVLSYAYARHYIPAVPHIEWQEESPGRLEYLTEAQVEHLLSVLVPEDALCLLILVSTGLRAGEFFSLKPHQIEDGWVRLWDTKNNQPRSVPIDPGDARELRALLEAGTLPKHDRFYDHFKAACKTAGYSAGLCVHSLRHTTGTWLAIKDGRGPVIQRLLGHSDYRTTQKYIHLADADRRTAAAKLRPSAGQSGAKGHFPGLLIRFRSLL
jgi:integrase